MQSVVLALIFWTLVSNSLADRWLRVWSWRTRVYLLCHLREIESRLQAI